MISYLYLQVVNTTPYTGMKVFPKSGCVPVGGVSELKVVFQPQSVDKFDVEVCVDVRELGRTLRIRLAGGVEQPTISIDKVRSYYFVCFLPSLSSFFSHVFYPMYNQNRLAALMSSYCYSFLGP